VKGTKSPFDGDWVYWVKRGKRLPGFSALEIDLLTKQKGKCTECKLHFTSEDVVEVDHIIPRSHGGNDKRSNKQLLHGHCHDAKTARDRKMQEQETQETGKGGKKPRNRSEKMSAPRGMDVGKIDEQIIRLKRLLNGEQVGEVGPLQPNDSGLMFMYRKFCSRYNVTERYASEVWKRYVNTEKEAEGMDAEKTPNKNMVKPHGLVYLWDLDAIAKSEWKPASIPEAVWQEAQKRKSQPIDEMIIDFEWQIRSGRTIQGGKLLPNELERLKQQYLDFQKRRNITQEHITRVMESEEGMKEPLWLTMQR
jgi:hypothetical protein